MEAGDSPRSARAQDVRAITAYLKKRVVGRVRMSHPTSEPFADLNLRNNSRSNLLEERRAAGDPAFEPFALRRMLAYPSQVLALAEGHDAQGRGQRVGFP